ncbi:hypothetical protein GCM10022212_29700 [Actimicrobium antarcticum]|uniref:Glutaredoxin domain-containing protein n=1 Tax=Actimicrobium antarcticum TaxID=1051899 RepID=A0ABP7TPW9_9BURK
MLCIGLTQSAIAQDFNGLLRGLMQGQGQGQGYGQGYGQGQSGDMLSNAIRSITDVSVGRVTNGAQMPQDAQGKVVMYRTAWCGYCKKAASYMQQKNIPFVERDIEANPSYRAEMKGLGGTGGVPFMVFGTKTQSGFSESSFDQNYAVFKRSLGNDNRAMPDSAIGPDRVGSAAGGGTGGLQSGDALVGRIAGIQVYQQPSKSSPKLLMLGRGDEVIYMGEERGGLYRVTSSRGEGWVDKLLVKKGG